MTHIVNLINDAVSATPFTLVSADTFLSQYQVSDQAALISALYIGRDHLHDNEIRDDYVPQSMVFDRYFITGDGNPRWDINPADFARILYEKSTNLGMYFTAFVRCANSSQLDLSYF
ncbi:hypothetical protein ACJW8B_16530 [Plesiomonas shigelloides]|uniref:hypothetical protein n=1 Tax=Plesiomonas shigelloides TaxID=703 RepID=UPI00387F2B50